MSVVSPEKKAADAVAQDLRHMLGPWAAPVLFEIRQWLIELGGPACTSATWGCYSLCDLAGILDWVLLWSNFKQVPAPSERSASDLSAWWLGGRDAAPDSGLAAG